MAYTAVLEHVKSKPLLLALEITLAVVLFGGIILVVLYFVYDHRLPVRCHQPLFDLCACRLHDDANH